MADAPIPTPLEAAQELSVLNAQLAALNAAGDAGHMHQYEQLGGNDAKIALSDRIARVRQGGAGSAPASATAVPAPAVDPKEAALGLDAPVPSDETAIERHLELIGTDVKAWSPEARTLSREVSALASTAGLTGDAAHLIRDFQVWPPWPASRRGPRIWRWPSWRAGTASAAPNASWTWRRSSGTSWATGHARRSWTTS